MMMIVMMMMMMINCFTVRIIELRPAGHFFRLKYFSTFLITTIPIQNKSELNLDCLNGHITDNDHTKTSHYFFNFDTT